MGHAGADLLFGHLGREYIDLSVTTSFRRAYESGFRSFTFRSLTGAPRYLQVEESESERIQALIAFAAWCCSSERNQVGTISGKLTAVQFFHRRGAGLELPTSSSLIKRALRGMANSHVMACTPRRVCLSIPWDVLLAGRCLIPSWGAGGGVP